VSQNRRPKPALHAVDCLWCPWVSASFPKRAGAARDLARHETDQHPERIHASAAYRRVILDGGTIGAAQAAYQASLDAWEKQRHDDPFAPFR
jgi:hypothetical protein